MFSIINASNDHVDWISQKLTAYYIKLNEVYGFEKYKTDIAIMMKHVSRRITESDPEYLYFVAVDENNQPVGFMNILMSRVPELLVLLTNDDVDNTGVVSSLITYLIEFLKGKGQPQFISEISEVDSSVGNFLKDLDSRLLESTYVTRL